MTKAALDTRVRLVVGEIRAFGPGKADLLDQIEKTGSISEAARQLGMSYSRAWSLVAAMNQAFKTPLVESATGGRKGGGAHVTDAGKRVLQIYRELQAALDKQAAGYAAPLKALLK